LHSASVESFSGAMKGAAPTALLVLIVDVALSTQVTPVQKVIQLLEGMSAKGKKRKT